MVQAKHNILIVDDDPGFRKTLSDILKIKGYVPFAVDRGQAALAGVQTEKPAVALIDLKLEDMSGLELMRAIKDDFPETECILLTGHASQTSAIEAINLGAYGYLQKPYSVEQLLVMIRRAVEKQEAETALRRATEQRQRLLQVTQKLLASLTVNEVIHQIERSLQELLTYDAFDLYWLNEEAVQLRPLFSANLAGTSPTGPPGDIPLGQGLVGRVIQSGQGELFNALAGSGKAHIICLPIHIKGKPVGVLLISRNQAQAFSAEEFELLQLFNSYVSLAITNAQLFEQTTLSEKRYRTLFEESKDAIAITTPAGKFVEVNSAAVELLGYGSQEELLQADLLEHFNNRPDLDKFSQSLVQQGFIKDFEFIMKRKDGHKVTVLSTATVMHDEAGAIVAYQAIGRDVTEHKHLEEQLRQSQKMDAIGRLAGGVAHDFNNLLTVITGYADLLLNLHPTAQDAERKDLEQISLAASRASSLTRQLLAFSRQQVLQPAVLNLNDIVSNIEKMLRRIIGEDIDLVTVLGAGLGQVKIDPGQMEQVILNLAVNARDAMPHGGKLTLETANVVLDQAYARRHVGVTAGPHILLIVSDTGEGMTDAIRLQIFEPFFTTKEQGKGTGLGLATVHGIINQSDGHISVESEPKLGAVFKVYLPQATEAVQPAKVAPSIVRAVLITETILLVEDNEAVRGLTDQVLRLNGYHTLLAGNGPEAIQLCRQHQADIHLLLTDVVMPGGMGGRQLAEQLVILQPTIKVLYMSGYTDDAVVRHGVLDWSKAFLQKPFTPEALIHKVREVLDAEIG